MNVVLVSCGTGTLAARIRSEKERKKERRKHLPHEEEMHRIPVMKIEVLLISIHMFPAVGS